MINLLKDINILNLETQVPTEWSSSADPSACEHIGYMIDGAKLYGYCEVNGAQVESCYVQVSCKENPAHICQILICKV